MNAVAFLQNQWFKHPERIAGSRRVATERMVADGIHEIEATCRLTARALFYQCLTGQRLQRALGTATGDIFWANASPKIGSKPSEAYDADVEHITKIVAHFKPGIVLLFGKVAEEGYYTAWDDATGDQNPVYDAFPKSQYVIKAPHPAARHASVVVELKAAAKRYNVLKQKLGE